MYENEIRLHLLTHINFMGILIFAERRTSEKHVAAAVAALINSFLCARFFNAP